MKVIQFEAQNNLFDEFMQWLYKHPNKDFNLTSVKDLNSKFDEDGIEYVSLEEQKELDEVLKNSECYESGHSKTISFETV